MGQLQKVNLSRSTAEDLEMGIRELEKRGYELVKKGVEEDSREVYNHTNKLGKSKYEFDFRHDITKHRAVMQRMWNG
ncbi:hypothetical protein [Sporosarcina jiandibaonis]|uniref:hypothetical protein n=1 Tax=Sporosarcina jiandibaonis TaxID=2715535 RepID=UPI001554D3C0|nr:hypothetical protein [Sporosarcina jiandibaonis]